MKQSPTDHKTYQAVTLANGLRALLVHNDQTQKSAAALAVNVGHFSDPEDRQGLAHFLEHMLFLGTEKYPDGSEYQKFISQYGGSNNAWTATEHTCFFFDIHHQHFEAALDRFSQFFISPLLSEEFVNKERKNIDAEFKLKLKDDIRRLYDVHKETINQAHPFAKFSVGNTETLADKPNKNLRDQVESFFQEFYVAKAMTLVIEGPQSLEDLQIFAEKYFSSVSKNDTGEKNPNVPLYLPEHQGCLIEVKPVKNDRQLIISFALPSIDKYYREKPESLISYLLGHEAKGSILSVLKHRHWALGLTAGSGVNGYNFKDFNISIRLTEEGQKHTDEIISLVFSYLKLLKQHDIPEFYYQEKKAIAELAFHYQEKTKPLDWVCQLVINMQHYPEADYIYGDYVMAGACQSTLSALLEKLNIDNMRYLLVSPDNETDQITKWYQVPYRVSKFSTKQDALWRNVDLQPILFLPNKNRYIVERPEVYLDQALKATTPQRLEHSSGYTVWYKQDQTFKVPKGYIYLGIDSPASMASEANIAMTRLFVDLYTESVIEEHYDAELAGIHYHLYAHQGGLTLQLSGLSEKQPLLLSQLLAELQHFSFSEQSFELMKVHLINHWKNNENSKSISQLFSVLSSKMQPKNPCALALANALHEVSFKQFLDFYPTILEQIKLDVLIHGNWQLSDAKTISQLIEQAFQGKCAQKHQSKIPMVDLKTQGNIYYPLHLPDHDHAAVIYYPFADKEIKTTALAIVCSQILSPQFFHQMRTEKQYGYLVGIGFVPINHYPGLAFYIQSPNYDAAHLIEAMDSFINESQQLLTIMPEQEWQHLQQGLASQLQEKDTSLRIKSQRFWNAICNEDLQFNQKARLIETLLQLNKSDIEQFLKLNFVNPINSHDRVCLASVKSTDDKKENKANDIFKNCSTKL